MPPFQGSTSANMNAVAAKSSSSAPTAMPSKPSISTTTTTNAKPRYKCSPITNSAAAFNLKHRLILPTFVIPTLIFVIPPILISILSVLAYATHPTTKHSSDGGRGDSLSSIIVTASIIIGSTFILSKLGFDAICRHAPNEMKKRDALSKSYVAIPFYSLVFSIVSLRLLYWMYYSIVGTTSGGDDYDREGSNRGVISWGWGVVTTTLFWSIKIAGACVGPALGWMVLSFLVVCRYAGPFCPIGEQLIFYRVFQCIYFLRPHLISQHAFFLS